MSRIVMRESDGEGQPRDGSAIQHPSSYGYESYETNGQRRRSRRCQLPRNENQEVRPEVTKTFICMQPGCPRTFSSRFKLVRHILIHSGERRFECTNCGRRFHRKDHLKNHLQVHNPNKILLSCDFCQKTYCSSISFRKHLAVHSAESGDLVCKLCGKMLADKEGILHHLKVHTGSRTLRGPSERKFPCDRCDRSFFTKKDVKRHLVVHTGKRDFVCQFCPQRFGRKDHLVRHTKKSHIGNSNNHNGNNHHLNLNNNSNNSPPNEPVRRYNPPAPIPPMESHKNGSLLVPPPLPDISGLVVPPTPVPPTPVPSMIDNPGDLKGDPYSVPPPPNLVQPNYNINPMPNENSQSLGRFSEPPLLPVSQYLPISQSYAGVTPMMPHYLNMSTSSNILSELLPPMSIASSFTSSLSLDVGNPPLPHFSQAFQ